jgi:prevent-host-death family protein
MAARSIPQRELRNNIGEILREAEAGTEFTVTVRGRPVARLGPLDQPMGRRVDVDVATVRTLLAETPVDDRLSSDLAEMRRNEQPVDDPWRHG